MNRAIDNFIDNVISSSYHGIFSVLLFLVYLKMVYKKKIARSMTIVNALSNSGVSSRYFIILSNSYYLPFLWILSALISYSGIVQKWFLKGKTDNFGARFQLYQVGIENISVHLDETVF
ncbi:hypothetical protein B9Z55_003175 [Caenorhabditis nigoni]|nr:hypothetical protein B9Z55_003175 [Caenorhabditis nigoni]